jgi:hypothetical protein
VGTSGTDLESNLLVTMRPFDVETSSQSNSSEED